MITFCAFEPLEKEHLASSKPSQLHSLLKKHRSGRSTSRYKKIQNDNLKVKR